MQHFEYVQTEKWCQILLAKTCSLFLSSNISHF